MYRCQSCGKTVEPGTRAAIIVSEQKIIEHPFRSAVNRVKTASGRVEWSPDQGGRGKQIVKEIRVCPACADKHRSVANPE